MVLSGSAIALALALWLEPRAEIPVKYRTLLNYSVGEVQIGHGWEKDVFGRYWIIEQKLGSGYQLLLPNGRTEGRYMDSVEVLCVCKKVIDGGELACELTFDFWGELSFGYGSYPRVKCIVNGDIDNIIIDEATAETKEAVLIDGVLHLYLVPYRRKNDDAPKSSGE